ncbi:DUF1254 domain-containing protein [Mycolicibacterium palauense]|uniref:DUF1254 domain-containing protein n=1 Tax=Mycolicibacterium palauense TaxID=2034511 RepID=UPI000BFF032C|nr:DUF1254 domain-containing protein [Mycolicibacterium palauense]
MPKTSPTTLPTDLRTLAYEAFVYFYPLVTMDYTRRLGFSSPPDRPGFGPPNEFHHLRAYPDADFRSVVRPNFDTLYSIAWLDLTAGPVLLGVPDTGGRYFMLPMLDMWTDVFANPGSRTTGTGTQTYVVTGPGGNTGATPPGVPVIVAPTPYVWVIGRTQTNGPDDYPAVHRVQDGYSITALGPAAPPTVVDPVDPDTEPLRAVNAMPAVEFLSLAADLIAVNPPHPTDFSQLARLSALGIGTGLSWDPDRFSAEEVARLEQGRSDALTAITSAGTTLALPVNGWMSMTENVGVYGNSYLRRAALTMYGLGANPPEDAVYPLLVADADGQALSGEHDYVLHFEADQLPPVDAFWSVTMYDAEGYQVDNELGRFALGDRDPLTFNDDGSLDLYLQHSNPGPQRESNWLPAPTGPLGVTMRLYAPRRGILDASWNPPPMKRVG